MLIPIFGLKIYHWKRVRFEKMSTTSSRLPSFNLLVDFWKDKDQETAPQELTTKPPKKVLKLHTFWNEKMFQKIMCFLKMAFHVLYFQVQLQVLWPSTRLLKAAYCDVMDHNRNLLSNSFVLGDQFDNLFLVGIWTQMKNVPHHKLSWGIPCSFIENNKEKTWKQWKPSFRSVPMFDQRHLETGNTFLAETRTDQPKLHQPDQPNYCCWWHSNPVVASVSSINSFPSWISTLQFDHHQQ